MTRAILKKEIASHKPFLILIISISLFIPVFNFFMEAQNLSTIDSLVGVFSGDNYTNYMIIYLICALTMTSGLLMREYEERTIEFLSSLPVSLGRVFYIKYLLSIFIILLIPATEILYGLITHIFSRNSMIMGFYPDVLFSILFLHFYQITFFITLGIFLSFFKRFSWILMALIFWTYIALEQIFPEIAVMNFLQVTRLKFLGDRIIIPWKMLLFQTPAMIILFCINYLIFVDPRKKIFEFYERLKARAHKKVLLYIITVFSIILFGSIIVMYSFMSENDPILGNDLEGENYLEFSEENEGIGTSEKDSERFHFVYPTAYMRRVDELLPLADGIYDKISSFFEYNHSFKINVDLTGTSKNLAGQAHWQNIYLDFSSVAEEPEFTAVLGHETTHVFLENMTSRRLSNDFINNKFFHEGMASYIEYLYFRDEQSLITMRQEAGISYALRNLSLEELINYDTFRTYYNHRLIYQYGFFFCESMVDVYGTESIKKVLDIFSEKEETFKLSGIEKWRSVFQYAQMNIEEVFLNFQQKLNRYGVDLEEDIDFFNKIRCAVEEGDEFISIIPNDIQIGSGWSLHCIVRNSALEKNENLKTHYLNSDSRFSIRKKNLPRSGFWYQLYIKKNDNSKVFYLPWEEVSF